MAAAQSYHAGHKQLKRKCIDQWSLENSEISKKEEELTLRTNPVSTLLSSWIQSMKRMARTTVSILLLIPCTFLAADNPVEAVHRGNQAQIQSYLKGHADLEGRDGDGNTALHWAALNGNPVL